MASASLETAKVRWTITPPHISTATGVAPVTQGKAKAKYYIMRTEAACSHRGDQHSVGLAHIGFALLAN